MSGTLEVDVADALDGPWQAAIAPTVAQRVRRLYAGLLLFGFSLALMVKARLGLGPWDVLHQGVATGLGVDIGWVVIAVAAVVLLAWIPLHQRPGFGTVSNVIVVGLVVNASVVVLSAPTHLAVRAAFLGAGVILNAVATGLYIGAGLGPGPRDGLMTGLARRSHSIRVVRTVIELVVLAAGVLLGGTVGIGTIVFALTIGPLAHFFLGLLTLDTQVTSSRASLAPHPKKVGR